MSLKMENLASNPIATRLKHEMRKRGMTSTELARRAEVKTSFIYDVLSGKSANPSTIKLARVADSLGVSLSYLAGHEPSGPHLSTVSPHESEYTAIAPLVSNSTDEPQNIAISRQQREPYLFHKAWINNHLHAPPADIRMALIRGDSMEPTLCHNDLILVDTTKRNPSPPGIFMLHDGFGLVAKRLEFLSDKQPAHIRVISDNPKYSSYECLPEDIRIVGRIVWFSREM